jgi:uncharacterized membrane protein YcfT
MAIMMVTLLHADMVLGWAYVDTGVSTEVHRFLISFRMPLFFTVSGFFASSAINGTWSSLWKRRLETYIWLFLLWSTAIWLFAKILPFSQDPTFGKEALDLIKSIVRPIAFIWFLWCLAVFYIVAKLVRRVDQRAVLAAFVVLSVTGLILPKLKVEHVFFNFFVGSLAYVNALVYLLFFWAGCQYRERIVSQVPKTSKQLISIFLVFAVSKLAAHFADVPIVVTAVLNLLSACAGLLLLLSVARGCVHFAPRVANMLRAVGARTVPLYVMQVPIMWILVTPLRSPNAYVDAYGGLIHIPLALLTVYVVKIVDVLATRMKLTWLFASPRTRWSSQPA